MLFTIFLFYPKNIYEEEFYMYLPEIIETKGKEDFRTEPIAHLFKSKRSVMVFSEIDSELAQSVIAQLLYLDEQDDSDIILYINSPGGSVSAGMAIYDYIKCGGLKSDVCTVATGVAASMGAFLLAAGEKGKRMATPSAEIMIHQPLGGVQGQATDISIVADHIQSTKKKLAEILAEECSKEYKKVLADMERDNWMSARSALEYGLIDMVGFPV